MPRHAEFSKQTGPLGCCFSRHRQQRVGKSRQPGWPDRQPPSPASQSATRWAVKSQSATRWAVKEGRPPRHTHTCSSSARCASSRDSCSRVASRVAVLREGGRRGGVGSREETVGGEDCASLCVLLVGEPAAAALMTGCGMPAAREPWQCSHSLSRQQHADDQCFPLSSPVLASRVQDTAHSTHSTYHA